MLENMFETISFHIVKPCNMKCKFCYATFQDIDIIKQMPKETAFKTIDMLQEAGLQKITFAGGEPLLYKWIYEVIDYSKWLGLTTSIITNGSLLTDDLIRKFKGKLDWIGLSVDSQEAHVNESIGRKYKENINYLDLCFRIKAAGFKLKINTVVNAYNFHCDMNQFITYVKPDRWKVFQALRVEGQNDKQFDEIKVNKYEFQSFINTHKTQPSLVPEDNHAMTGSYLLVDPYGRLFENSSGKHTYSSPVHLTSVESCLSQINLNRETFISRGGIYNW